MGRADREAFDRFLVTTQDPLAYEAGTQESRFNRYVKRNPERPTHQAFCLRCLGGGKFLGRPGSQRAADREATSHMSAYGHAVTILPAKNPRRRSAPRSRSVRETSGLPWGWIFAGVFFWTWSLNRGATTGVTAPGDTTPYVSLSDAVRGMQADADALAVAAEAEGSPYVSLSDWVRSL